MSHDEGACDIARKHSFTGLKIMVEVPQALTDTVTEAYDGFEGRPVLIPLWNLRVILGGVSLINIRGGESGSRGNGQDHRHAGRFLSVQRLKW